MNSNHLSKDELNEKLNYINLVINKDGNVGNDQEGVFFYAIIEDFLELNSQT